MSISLDPEKTLKLVRYDYLNRTVVPGQILFAGSSLMEQFPVHEFQLGAGLSSLIYNRGIGGFTTAEMLEHMETCIYALRPARIFLNIGTNDMNPDDYRKEELMERYEKMVKEILAHLPGVQLTLLAYYPVNHEAACDDSWFLYRTNERICEANEAVKALSQKYSLGFLDLNAPLMDEKGRLKAEFTIDGVHMYPNGYREVWKQLAGILQ